jgi:hypothetical protein
MNYSVFPLSGKSYICYFVVFRVIIFALLIWFDLIIYVFTVTNFFYICILANVSKTSKIFSMFSYYISRMCAKMWICLLQVLETHQYAAAHTLGFFIGGSTLLYACIGAVVCINVHSPLLPCDLLGSVHSVFWR